MRRVWGNCFVSDFEGSICGMLKWRQSPGCFLKSSVCLKFSPQQYCLSFLIHPLVFYFVWLSFLKLFFENTNKEKKHLTAGTSPACREEVLLSALSSAVSLYIYIQPQLLLLQAPSARLQQHIHHRGGKMEEGPIYTCSSIDLWPVLCGGKALLTCTQIWTWKGLWNKERKAMRFLLHTVSVIWLTAQTRCQAACESI